MTRTVLSTSTLILLTVLCSATIAAPPASSSRSMRSAPTQPNVTRSSERLPLSFERNEGQTDPGVKFLSRRAGQTLFLTSREAVLVLSARRSERSTHEPRDFDTSSTRSVVLRMTPLGANAHARVVGLEPLPGHANYFIGNDPKRWHTDVPTYARVRYEQIYPGIDAIFYGHARQVEYDFVVAPGGDPGRIRVRIEGAHTQSLDEDGDVLLQTDNGDVRVRRPRVYQEIKGTRKDVDGGYVLKGHELRFRVGTYDRGRPLVIDPVLVYSTYLGGSNFDEAHAVAVDADGNAYVTGGALSADFPVFPKPGAYSSVGPGAFVTKLNPGGTALIYSTYFGSNDARGYGIALDAPRNPNAYVVGLIGANGSIPTTANAVQSTTGVAQPAFVAKLSAGGNALLYSTYFGGTEAGAAGFGIAADAAGHAYVTGYAFHCVSSSGDYVGCASFQITPGVVQQAYGGGQDAFVAKIDTTAQSSSTALVYSMYLGGSDFDLGWAIAIDANGNAFVTGQTLSTDFPRQGNFRPHSINATCTLTGGTNNPDAFVTKISADGKVWGYSTYWGGSCDDSGRGIAVDAFDNAYVTGTTASTDFPVTPNAFQTQKASPPFNFSGYDVFVTKFDSNGNATGPTAPLYSTYVGGGQESEVGYAIALDGFGNAFITGTTRSTDFPVTPGAEQTALGAGLDPKTDPCASPASRTPNYGDLGDAVLTVLRPANAGPLDLVYSTYLGGSGLEGSGAAGFSSVAGGIGVAVDAFDNAYIASFTDSTDFPVFPGPPKSPTAYQTSSGGGVDAFVAKFRLACAATLNTVSVNTAQQLVNAVAGAKKGDVITLAPGTYDLSGVPTLSPPADVTIRGAGCIPSRIVLLNAAIGSYEASGVVPHVLVENLTFKNTSRTALNPDGGSLVFRHGGIDATPGLYQSAVEGDIGPLTLVDVAIVGKKNGTGFGINYNGGKTREGFGALTLRDVSVCGFDIGIPSMDANDPITIVNTSVSGNTAAACDMASNAALVTVGSASDDGTCPFTLRIPNTPTGSPSVSPPDLQNGTTLVTITFSPGTVTQAGETTVYSVGSAGPLPPANFVLGNPPIFYQVDTTALFSGQIEVCITFNPASFPAGTTPTLVHFDSSGSPTVVAPNSNSTSTKICGYVTSLSPFAILGQLPADTTPPTTVATPSPGPNANGWNNTNVSVTLTSMDNESGGTGVKNIQYALTGAQSTNGFVVVTASAASVTIAAEGTTTLTYFAVDNAGNQEALQTLRVQIDATRPTVTCSLNPNILWPPNHQLVPVSASVTVTDALSGSAGFLLTSIASNESATVPGAGRTANDIQGFVVGTSSTGGLLRAERSGLGSGRIYALTYSGMDMAGNSAVCSATVTVPHDQRR